MRSAILIGSAIVALIVLVPQTSRAQDLHSEIEAIVKDYLASHPDEVGEIAKDYFIKHPETVGQILAEVLKHRSAANTSTGTAPPAAKTVAERSAVIADNAALLFNSPHQVTLGDPPGSITLVEFFDYNCGFCKRAMPDMLALLKDNPKLKIVLKEFPILGPTSVEAARVAVAVRMQDADGKKYLAFHRELLGGPGPATREKALAAAKDQGLDMARLENDAASDEVSATLAESRKLAADVGISGTPGYVIGKNVVLGAVGLTALQAQIEMARQRSAIAN